MEKALNHENTDIDANLLTMARYGRSIRRLRRPRASLAMQTVAAEIIRLLTFKSTVSILDLGYGSGRHWNGITLPCSVSLTVIDASEDWVKANVSPRPNTILIGVMPPVLNDLEDSSFDIVIAYDLIEHLPKHEGVLLVYHMQRLAKSMAFLYTPNGFVWQPPSDDNPYNAHLSGWSVGELKALGWSSFQGHGGNRYLVGPYGVGKFRSKNMLLQNLLTVLHTLSNCSPKLSFGISATIRH